MARTQGNRAHGDGGGRGDGARIVNAFTADFLDRLLEVDQPATAAEAAVAGPWEVEEAAGYGWGVYRHGEGGGAPGRVRGGRGDGRGGDGRGGAAGGEEPEERGAARRGEPAGLLEERQDALLLAAALPGSARCGELRLRPDRGPDGYPLMAGGRDVGRLAWFDTQLVATLAALRALVACPRCLALVLEAAGHDALEQAGRIVAGRTGTPPPS